jgi:hypothetical protein
MLCFAAITALLVETNWYYKQCSDFLDDGQPLVLGGPEYEIFLFLSVFIQMGHIFVSLKDH